MKHIFILIVCYSLSGCSFVVDLVLFNNMDAEVEICNLHYLEAACIKVKPDQSGKIALISTKKVDMWAYKINGNIYKFNFGPYPEQASKIYCKGILQKRCDIPLQLESSGKLYWVGKENTLPVSVFPNQPKGFPVKPNA